MTRPPGHRFVVVSVPEREAIGQQYSGWTLGYSIPGRVLAPLLLLPDGTRYLLRSSSSSHREYASSSSSSSTSSRALVELMRAGPLSA
jgi:hypothetical protein